LEYSDFLAEGLQTRFHFFRPNLCRTIRKKRASTKIASMETGNRNLRIGIIGAGISGMAAARRLTDAGMEVVVIEKSRGVGGRMATRRLEDGIGFDHGAQYFTVRDPGFRRHVNDWLDAGLLMPWPLDESGRPARFAVLNSKNGVDREQQACERFVAVPAMNAICRYLGEGLEIRKQSRVAAVQREGDRLALTFHELPESLIVDRVITTAPAPQSAELLADFPHLASELRSIRIAPCWATMVLLAEPLGVAWQGAFVDESLLNWVARNGTKPQRHSPGESLILHANPVWTEESWEQPPEEVARKMLDEFWKVSRCRRQTPLHVESHRWKYALPASNGGPYGPRHDQSMEVVACGDWSEEGSRIEGAFLSGWKAAGLLIDPLR
jgi:predicted NAD/FAD-dependent oxidoreductase